MRPRLRDRDAFGAIARQDTAPSVGKLMRLADSIREGTVAPSLILRKLSAYRRRNKLDLAVRELGRIERKLFTLDWLEQPDLRRACRAGLNKGEARQPWVTQSTPTAKAGSPIVLSRTSNTGQLGSTRAAGCASSRRMFSLWPA